MKQSEFDRIKVGDILFTNPGIGYKDGCILVNKIEGLYVGYIQIRMHQYTRTSEKIHTYSAPYGNYHCRSLRFATDEELLEIKKLLKEGEEQNKERKSYCDAIAMLEL